MQKSSMKRRQREVQLNGEHRVSDAFFFFFLRWNKMQAARIRPMFFSEKYDEEGRRERIALLAAKKNLGIESNVVVSVILLPLLTNLVQWGTKEEQFRVFVRIWIEENTRRIGFFTVNIIIKFRGFTIVKSNITRIKIQAIVQSYFSSY